MTAAQFKPVKTVGQRAAAPQVNAPAAPVELPETGKMLNVVLGVLLLILLSSVVMHYL